MLARHSQMLCIVIWVASDDNILEGSHVVRQSGLPRYEGVVREPHAGPDVGVSATSTLGSRCHADHTTFVEPGVGPDNVGVAGDGEGGEDDGGKGETMETGETE